MQRMCVETIVGGTKPPFPTHSFPVENTNILQTLDFNYK